MSEGKYFYLKKRITQIDKKNYRSWRKRNNFEPFQSRVYTHANLFSHIIGQVDYDNYGISGIEKYFDKELKNKNTANQYLELTLDTNIQHLIDKIKRNLTAFSASGGGALLMNVENGEILSMFPT